MQNPFVEMVRSINYFSLDKQTITPLQGTSFCIKPNSNIAPAKIYRNSTETGLLQYLKPAQKLYPNETVMHYSCVEGQAENEEASAIQCINGEWKVGERAFFVSQCKVEFES
jgi:hypothetical protein